MSEKTRTLIEEARHGQHVIDCALDDIAAHVCEELEGVASDLEGTLDADDVPSLNDAVDSIRAIAAQFREGKP
tara:strand:+ start:798 stop:1016 length:219 start_codon:yes stop_codon:yes gene_type:complete